jgi:membrane protease YdiL (CAAX protease family)
MNRRIVLHFGVAWLLFLVASAAPGLLGHIGLQPWLDGVPWLRQFIVKTVLVGLAFAAMARDGRPLSSFGFRRSSPWPRRLLLAGFGLGLLSTLLVIVTPAHGMTALFKGFGVLALVLSIWIYSSVTEEIFTRGWFQSAVSPAVDSGEAPDAAVVASALLFGSMHLSLLWMGADLWTVAIIVVATTLLGRAAAVARRRSGSLVPAILVHVLFNVGGFVAGAAYTIQAMARTGKPPVM